MIQAIHSRLFRAEIADIVMQVPFAKYMAMAQATQSFPCMNKRLLFPGLLATRSALTETAHLHAGNHHAKGKGACVCVMLTGICACNQQMYMTSGGHMILSASA